MTDSRRLWLQTLAVTSGALYLAGVFTLGTLENQWAAFGQLPYGFELIRDWSQVGPATMHLLASIPALLIAWLAARMAMSTLSSRWLPTTVAIVLLVLPLAVGVEQNGSLRWIALGSSMHWYPGPWAVLALVPALVHLALRWRQTRRSSFIFAHIAISASGLTLLAMQPDAMLVWLLAVASAATMIFARPRPGVLAVLALGALVIPLWLALAPMGFLRSMHLGGYFGVHDFVSCGFFGADVDPRGIAWRTSDWIGSGDTTASQWLFSLEDIAEGWVLTAVAALFGRAAALGLVLVAMLQGAALIGLGRRGREDTVLQRRGIQLYGLMVLTMGATAAAGTIGYEVPPFGIPWVSYGINLLFLTSAVLGSAVGVAYEGSIRLPWPWLEGAVSRAEAMLLRTETALDSAVNRWLLL